MKIKSIISLLSIVLVMGCIPSSDEKKVGQNEMQQVEIALKDKLDGVTNNYCLDIAGGNKDIDISKGLQAHTCYSYQGKLGNDQIFSTEKFDDNVLYMPVYDVCATLSSLENGSKVGLATCDNSELQALSFSDAGMIQAISSPDMCLTVAIDTRFGRAKQHQIKNLTLEPCSEKLAKYQTWYARTSMNN